MNESRRQQGKPPKSASAIRAALDAVRHGNGPPPAAGPQTGGMQPDDRLTIASFYDRRLQFSVRDILFAMTLLSLLFLSWRALGIVWR
ncbi:MAG TPA: hypothetical protein VGN42_14970 [Pirellulales bacterium]|jgi:hypothetical protein|nr:hypothetical protein [Pirellulales bacterium]